MSRDTKDMSLNVAATCHKEITSARFAKKICRDIMTCHDIIATCLQDHAMSSPASDVARHGTCRKKLVTMLCHGDMLPTLRRHSPHRAAPLRTLSVHISWIGRMHTPRHFIIATHSWRVGGNKVAWDNIPCTVADNNDDGTSLVNQGNKYKGPPCSRCRHTNHPIEKCIARRHKNGTLLYVDSETPDGYGAGEVSDNAFGVFFDGIYDLMFVHSNTENSPMTQKSSSKGGIPSTWILLHSQSSIDVFCNASLLSQIHKTNTKTHIRCNAGDKSTN